MRAAALVLSVLLLAGAQAAPTTLVLYLHFSPGSSSDVLAAGTTSENEMSTEPRPDATGVRRVESSDNAHWTGRRTLAAPLTLAPEGSIRLYIADRTPTTPAPMSVTTTVRLFLLDPEGLPVETPDGRVFMLVGEPDVGARVTTTLPDPNEEGWRVLTFTPNPLPGGWLTLPPGHQLKLGFITSAHAAIAPFGPATAAVDPAVDVVVDASPEAVIIPLAPTPGVTLPSLLGGTPLCPGRPGCQELVIIEERPSDNEVDVQVRDTVRSQLDGSTMEGLRRIDRVHPAFSSFCSDSFTCPTRLELDLAG